MTFESMIDTPNNVNVTTDNVTYPPLPAPAQAPSPLEQALAVETEEQLIVKVVFGNDIRRANSVARYAPLHEVCSKIFGLDVATTVLKYQDEEGDKITMSSDNELNEARKLAQDKVLRLFIENKAAPAQDVPIQEAPAFPCGMVFPWAQRPFTGHHFGPRGGFGGRGGFRGGRGGFYHAPHHQPPFAPYGAPFPGHHAPPHPHPHPHGAPFGHHAFPPQPAASPVQTTTYQQPQQGGTTTATYSTAHVTSHGVFSSASDSPNSHCKNARAEASPYARCAWKERKEAMKEHIKFMKANCATEEDRQALKQFKRQACEELKMEKKAFKEDKKCGKKDKKDKKDKCEKREKKDKKEKCEKWEKKCEKKKNQLMARHVADVTIPDNSELPADTPVTKTWRLRNVGHIAWPEDSQLLFINRRGDDLNGPERVFVGAVEPQQEIDVSVTFVTPAEPGRYIGYYRMAASTGKFGQRVWVSFIIPAPAAPMTTETPKEDDKASAPSALLDVAMD